MKKIMNKSIFSKLSFCFNLKMLNGKKSELNLFNSIKLTDKRLNNLFLSDD